MIFTLEATGANVGANATIIDVIAEDGAVFARTTVFTYERAFGAIITTVCA